MQTRISPQSESELAKVTAAGHSLKRIFQQDDLVSSDNTYFVATGVTDGMLVRGVARVGNYVRTDSVILRSRSGTIRRVTADYLADRWM
ncbi:MAG: fructose 1,6-bisphosphatase [Actinomycetota bacterium]|jgi:fructose-1,6-bisphosphatase II